MRTCTHTQKYTNTHTSTNTPSYENTTSYSSVLACASPQTSMLTTSSRDRTRQKIDLLRLDEIQCGAHVDSPDSLRPRRTQAASETASKGEASLLRKHPP